MVIEHAVTKSFWQRFERSRISLRLWLVALGLSPLGAAVDLLILMGLVYGLSLSGLFLPLIQQGAGAEPPVWVFWLGDPAWAQVICFSLLGLVGGFVCRGLPVMTCAGLILLFPGFLSVKACALLIFSERLGIRLWTMTQATGQSLARRTEWRVTSFLRCLVLIILLFTSQWIQPLISQMVGITSIFHPASRLSLTFLVVGLGLCFEVVMNMVFLHFYFVGQARPRKN